MTRATTIPSSSHTSPGSAAVSASGTAFVAGGAAGAVADPGVGADPSAVDGGEPRIVLRCTGTADFLAALPFLTGFTARDSLFVVLFQGKRAGRALRVDLPQRGTPRAIGALLDGVCELLERSGAGPEGPALVITSERSFAEADGVPWRHLGRLLRRRFAREGWPLRELAIVAPDGWAELLREDTRVEVRPLEEISASPIAAQAAEAGYESRPLDRLGRLPEAAPERAAAVLARLSELDRRADVAPTGSNAGEAGTPSWVYGVVRVAGACLDGEGLPDPRLTARLIRAAESSDRWLLVLLTAVSRAEFVLELVSQADPGRFVGVPIDLEGSPAGDPSPGWSIHRLLHPLAAERPDAGKLMRAVEVFSDAATHAPVARRPGLLALLAWAWWMRGMGSVAARLVEEAREIDAEHALTLMIDRLIASPPAWAWEAESEGSRGRHSSPREGC